MTLPDQPESSKSEKRGAQTEGNAQFFISFLWLKHHHIYNAHQNITMHYHCIIIKALMWEPRNPVGNSACPSEDLAKVSRDSFTELLGPTRKEPNSARRKLWFSSILVVLMEITECTLSKPRASPGVLSAAIRAWHGQALCAILQMSNCTKLHRARLSFWLRSAAVREQLLPRTVCRFWCVSGLSFLMIHWTSPFLLLLIPVYPIKVYAQHLRKIYQHPLNILCHAEIMSKSLDEALQDSLRNLCSN